MIRRALLGLALAALAGQALGTDSLVVPASTNVIAQSGVAIATPADTTEDTLATVTIPANTMGATGCIRIFTLWDFTGSVNSKTMKVRFGATAGTGNGYLSISDTTATHTAATFLTTICNRTTGTQVGTPPTGSPGTGASALQTASLDTTAQTVISFTGTKASAGETLNLDAYRVEK